jgi:hypothetical protein
MQDVVHVILHLSLVPLLYNAHIRDVCQLLVLQSGEGLARLELESFHLRKLGF